MVASSHPDATKKALEVMQQGGNAFDAAVCAASILSVVEAHSTGIGGDCFCVFYSSRDKKVQAINGSGTTPQIIDYNKVKLTEQNTVDPYCASAITIPGAIAAWEKLLKDFGNLSFSEVLKPAIDYAENGYIVADVIADMWAREENKLAVDEDCKKVFLKEGKAYKVGETHYQPQLASTLKKIIKYGKNGFYEGEVAEDMVYKLKKIGGTHTLEDFKSLAVEYVDPIYTSYKGYDVFECPPNGQGIVALLMLNILENFNLANLNPDSYERIHLEAEVSKLAFYHRNKYLGDPAFVNVPVEKILSKKYAKKLSTFINRKSTISNLSIEDIPNHKDTVYISVVDKDRNFVSFINSIFHPFGSGIVAPKSGVLLHNRGASFNLNIGHPNYLKPLKRPMHTIIPALLMKNNLPIMPFGVMGAHYQPVGQAHFLNNVLDYNMDVQEALDNPRSFNYEGVLSLEKTFSKDVFKQLADLGHQVNYTDLPHGGGQAIFLKENKILVGGSDPRKDGIALGF
jgi:gamma-glutamyltranspeptidase/glutathione hydrolase